MNIRKALKLDTWYGPMLVWWIAMGLVIVAGILDWLLRIRLPRLVAECLGLTLLSLCGGATIYVFITFVVTLVRKQWLRALLQFVTAAVSAVIAFYVMAFLMFACMFGGPSEDHFADDLTIPPEVAANLVVPEKEISTSFSTMAIYDDDFARAIFKEMGRDGGDDPTVTCDLSALADLVRSRRDELTAYLARHPGWWLHEDGGRLCATRRLRVRGVWNHPLHGCYSGHTREHGPDEDFAAYQKATYFQTRTSVGFPHSPFGRNRGAEHPAKATVAPELGKGNLDTFESRVLFGDNDFCVDVFEQSPAKERRITNAALAFLKDEFATLKLPEDAAVRGPEQFVLRNGMQPGIYNLTLRVNPGEPGVTYLKAFEVTKGTRLSEGRLESCDNERVGWSSDPDEKFLFENEFTIYEGDWGKPYAARIEVWFRPDSGKPERKLMERTCKVEGWQR